MYIFSHVPQYLVGSSYISTACADKVVKKADLIELTLARDAVVLVYRDAALLSPPMTWLETLGFAPVVERLVAHRYRT